MSAFVQRQSQSDSWVIAPHLSCSKKGREKALSFKILTISFLFLSILTTSGSQDSNPESSERLPVTVTTSLWLLHAFPKKCLSQLYSCRKDKKAFIFITVIWECLFLFFFCKNCKDCKIQTQPVNMMHDLQRKLSKGITDIVWRSLIPVNSAEIITTFNVKLWRSEVMQFMTYRFHRWGWSAAALRPTLCVVDFNLRGFCYSSFKWFFFNSKVFM